MQYSAPMTSSTDPRPQLSLQRQFAPRSRCFGCGPANTSGLRIESFPDGEGGLVATWTPADHHEAFDGVLNGGIIGALMDCHSNWTAANHLMTRRHADRPPVCVTSEYAVRWLRPTPTDRPLTIRSRVAESTDDRATIDAWIESDGAQTATCRGTFVGVGPGHPAYAAWER